MEIIRYSWTTKCHKKVCNWWIFLWIIFFLSFVGLSRPLVWLHQTISDNILRNAIKVLKVIHQLYWRHSINGQENWVKLHICREQRKFRNQQPTTYCSSNFMETSISFHWVESVIKVVCSVIDTFFFNSIWIIYLSRSIESETSEKVLWKHRSLNNAHIGRHRPTDKSHFVFVSILFLVLFSSVSNCLITIYTCIWPEKWAC